MTKVNVLARTHAVGLQRVSRVYSNNSRQAFQSSTQLTKVEIKTQDKRWKTHLSQGASQWSVRRRGYKRPRIDDHLSGTTRKTKNGGEGGGGVAYAIAVLRVQRPGVCLFLLLSSYLA